MAPAIGLEPQSQPLGSPDTPLTKSSHNHSSSIQNKHLEDSIEGFSGHIRAFPQHDKDTRTHKKCAQSVAYVCLFLKAEVPEDLAKVVKLC